ncbi:hypothetical protein H2200_007958 [Cladophialophora chaetospira]|uniref:Uncharacterized protein n=1 Tax=Cladophialophora chaetospira TaxID=386627 RepID=A0AA38X6X2_9EURO|nr:hypothetical protein H2200_007958 [Cladophialophora chaetospira]
MATDTTQPRLRRKHRFNVRQGRIVVDNDGSSFGRSQDEKHRDAIWVADRPGESKTGDPIYSRTQAEGYTYRLLTNRSVKLSTAGLLHIEDLYALIDGLHWVKDELKAQLPANPDIDAPDHLHKIPPILQIISSLLAVEDIFEYETAEAYIESRTFDNFGEIPSTLANAEARIFNVLSLLADLEQCTWLQEAEIYHLLVGMRVTNQIEIQKLGKISDLKFKLIRSRLARAEVRDYLQNLISDLSTPRLKALKFRPHTEFQMPREIAELPVPLPLEVTFVQAFMYELGNQLPTPPPTPSKHGHKCLLCRHDTNTDPKRAGYNAKPQLLTYTNLCCKSGPYHVVCMLSYIKTNQGSEATCPYCYDELGEEYFMEVMERRSFELQMMRGDDETGRSDASGGRPGDVMTQKA